jgi:hypothetical protein
MAVKVGNSAITVTSVGRMVAPGNSQTHSLKIVNASNSTDMVSTTLNLQGLSSGSYAYATLASPVTLSANSTYYILSQEVWGSDQWYDNDTTVTTTQAGTVTSAVYCTTTLPYIITSTSNHEYVPVNFTYRSASSTSANQYYIAIRTDNLSGSGTQADPYDGSTATKFDAVMSKLQWVASPGIHLVGPGPFETYATHTWFARSGWEVSGDGMYATTVQIVGNVAGIHHDVEAFKSDVTVNTNSVTIRDLTIDCNWATLSQTADTGLGGEKNISVYAICLFGSNHLVERVRFINAYGSLANNQEAFGILIVSSPNADATGNVIAYCRGESPAGNHGSTFNITGYGFADGTGRLVTNSQIHDCVGIGINNGSNPGFENGGANFGNAKGCQIYNNSFTDCGSAFYCDTGTLENIQISNNTLVRGHLGIALVQGADLAWTKNNIQITGNNLNIQNRNAGPGDGIVVAYSAASNITISGNTISYDTSAGGDQKDFWGISLWYPQVTTATVSNNVIGYAYYLVTNRVWGTSLTMFNNRHPDGILIPELNNQ